MKNKTFRVGIWEEQGGYVMVKAKDQQEANDLVEETLNEDGVEGFKDFDMTHRAVDITDITEIKDKELKSKTKQKKYCINCGYVEAQTNKNCKKCGKKLIYPI